LHSVEGQRRGRGEPLTRLWLSPLFSVCPYGKTLYHTVRVFPKLRVAQCCSYDCGMA